MSMLKRFIEGLQGKQITPKTAAIAITAVVVIALVIIFAIGRNAGAPPETATTEVATPESASSEPSTSEGPVVSMQAIPSGKSEATGKKTDSVKDAKSELPARPTDPYAVIAERNIFKPVTETALAPPPSRPVPPMPVGPLPGSGFGFPGGMGRGGGGGQTGNSKIAFTGVVQSPDGIYALLENLATGETRYARTGDNAFGMQVTDVNPSMVSLDSGGQPMRLMIGENKTDTTATPTPTPGAPPQPPGPGASPPSGPPPGMPGAMPSFGDGNSGRRGRRGMNGPPSGPGQ